MTDAMTNLLCVRGAFQPCKVAVGVDSPQENGLELVHAGVGKQQGGVIVGDHTAGWHLCVALGLEEFDEGCSHSVACVATACGLMSGL